MVAGLVKTITLMPRWVRGSFMGTRTTKQEKTIEERAQDFYDAAFDKELLHLMEVAEGEKKPNKHERDDGINEEDDARQRICESAYAVDREVVYYVTLAGGGPAARLKVPIGDDGAV